MIKTPALMLAQQTEQGKTDVRAEAEQAILLGRKLYQEGENAEALQQYTRALELFRMAGDHQQEADVLSDIAVVYRRLGEFEHSLELQQQALNIYTELGDTQGQAKALRRIGVLDRHQGNLFQSISSYEQALALMQQEEDQEGIAATYTNIGIVYGDLGRLADAQQYFTKALEIYQHLQNQAGISYTLGNLGQLFLYLGDSTQALHYLEQSLAIKRTLADTRGEANTLLNIGTAYKNLGDFQQAFTFYYQSLDLYTQIHDLHGKAAALGSIGTMYEELGDINRALQFQMQSLEIKKMIRTPIQLTIALLNLASLAIKQLRFAEAERYLQEGLTIALEHNSLFAQANIYGQMGVADLRQNNIQEALQNFFRAVKLYEEVGSQKGKLEILDYIGQAYIQQAQFRDALPYYREALRLAQTINDSNTLWQIHYWLGEIAFRLGDETLALEEFTVSIETLEQMRSYLEVPELRRLFMRQNLNPYMRTIQLLLRQERQKEALVYLERFKARTFLELVAYGKPLLQVVPTLVQEEKILATRIRYLSERLMSAFSSETEFLFLDSETEGTSQDIEQELDRAKEDYEQLLLRMKLTYPEYYRLKIVDADEIQTLVDTAMNLLEDDVALLEYFLDDQAAHIWIIERHQIHYTLIPVSYKEIIDTILQFRNELTNYESNKIYTPLQHLYSWLICPVESYLKEKTIVGIIPFQILHFVPFSALVKNFSASSDGQETLADIQFLIEDYAVFALPSLSMLPVVREMSQRNLEYAPNSLRRYFLGIGSANENLPGAKEEIQTVLQYFPHSAGYTGIDATKQRFLDEADKYEIVHLATHGVYDKEHPMFSYLEFASGAYLYAREIFGLQLKCSLVTLSGCETLLPQNVDAEDIYTLVSGDELVGFIRAFLFAGTPSVLSSLWKVNDTATQYLMSAFYQNLPRLGKARAFQQASRAVMQTTIELGKRRKKEISLIHPFFWSSFVLVGDWK